MLRLKHIPLIVLLATLCTTAFAQQETFDVISYALPKGWQKQQVEGGVQLAVTDNTTGGYAIAIITKALPSTASANENFSSQWKAFLVNTLTSIDAPTMLQPRKDADWDIISGNANYNDRGMKGAATLITATGYGQTATVVLMTNTQQYQNDLGAFINSLKLSKALQNKTVTTNAQPTTPSGNTNSQSLVGRWGNYINETIGYVNGMPMYSGGYFRREYVFSADGTYQFRVKDWSTSMKEILFVYETGTWTVKGNKLTLTPTKGHGEWWSKAASGKTSEWGTFQKTGTWKLESTTYTFELHYYSGMNETDLRLQSASQTEREGKQENNTATYSPRAKDNALIDNPPGFKDSKSAAPK